jgi:hypothetical protein
VKLASLLFLLPKKPIKKLVLWKDEPVARGTTSFVPSLTARRLLRGQSITAPPDNGEAPASFSLALSGGFGTRIARRLALSRLAAELLACILFLIRAFFFRLSVIAHRIQERYAAVKR